MKIDLTVTVGDSQYNLVSMELLKHQYLTGHTNQLLDELDYAESILLDKLNMVRFNKNLLGA